MKVVERIKFILGHICIICGIAIIVVQILDWYNPFMDFAGHSKLILYALCASSICLGICEVYVRPIHKKSKWERPK